MLALRYNSYCYLFLKYIKYSEPIEKQLLLILMLSSSIATIKSKKKGLLLLKSQSHHNGKMVRVDNIGIILKVFDLHFLIGKNIIDASRKIIEVIGFAKSAASFLKKRTYLRSLNTAFFIKNYRNHCKSMSIFFCWFK